MNIYKASDLIQKENCNRRYYFDSLGITTIKDKNYYLSIAIKKAVKEGDSSINFIDSLLDDKYFTPLSKKHEVELLSNQLDRYFRYLKANKAKKISNEVTQDINIKGKLVTVSCDLILEYPESEYVEIVKLKRSEPKLSYAARKSMNKPENSLELFLLYLLGKYLYPNKKVAASFHHMASKNDKNGFLLEYESKRGYNLISRDENTKEGYMTIDNVERLIEDNSKDTTLDTNNCQICSYKNICNYKKPQELELQKLTHINKAKNIFTLTKTQHSAINFEDGIVRINAGAGSGKTTIIALRVVELIDRGYEPEDILLITFTNKGAQEMKEKISYWLKEEGIEIDENRFNITTFNSWGDKVIKDNYKLLGFTEIPRLIEKVEKYDILFDILSKHKELEGCDYKNPLLNFRYSKGVVVQLENIFNYMKVCFVTLPEQLKDAVSEENIDEVLAMYKEYNNILKKKNLIEYQDQINLIMGFIDEEHEALDAYNYKHLIIDEFQDSDKMQMDLIVYLTNKSKFKSLMIVGDDSQSIYAFRNTSQENILSFHKYFKDVKDINMVENFRSTPEIIALANSLDKLNKKRIDKKLISGLPSGKIPLLKTFINSSDEYEFISSKIKELLKNRNPEDIAVIARTKMELFDLEEYLKELNIPYVIDVPEPLLNDSNIHIAKSLLQFLQNTDITQGLLEYLYIVNNKFKGLTKEEITTLINDTADEIKDEILLAEEDIRVKKFFKMLEIIDDDVFQKFLEDIKMREFTFPELYDYLTKFITYEDNKTLDKDNNRYRAITLTTAHTSKGKEFDVVFVTLSKFKADSNEDKDIDEERRVVYVSITRAKEELFITSTKISIQQHKLDNRFVDEIRETNKVSIN